MKGRNGKVSKALLPTALACALGMLATEPAAPPEVTAASVAIPVPACGLREREIRFEMLAADAEPELPAPHGLAVCLGVYRLPAAAP